PTVLYTTGLEGLATSLPAMVSGSSVGGWCCLSPLAVLGPMAAGQAMPGGSPETDRAAVTFGVPLVGVGGPAWDGTLGLPATGTWGFQAGFETGKVGALPGATGGGGTGMPASASTLTGGNAANSSSALEPQSVAEPATFLLLGF